MKKEFVVVAGSIGDVDTSLELKATPPPKAKALHSIQLLVQGEISPTETRFGFKRDTAEILPETFPASKLIASANVPPNARAYKFDEPLACTNSTSFVAKITVGANEVLPTTPATVLLVCEFEVE